jgi:hypothetical protein
MGCYSCFSSCTWKMTKLVRSSDILNLINYVEFNSNSNSVGLKPVLYSVHVTAT